MLKHPFDEEIARRKAQREGLAVDERQALALEQIADALLELRHFGMKSGERAAPSVFRSDDD